MICPGCQKELKHTWDTCPTCGYDLKTPVPPTEKPADASQDAVPSGAEASPGAFTEGEVKDRPAGPAVPEPAQPAASGNPVVRTWRFFRKVLTGTTNFLQRFVLFVLVNQMLYLLMAIIIRLQVGFESKNAASWTFLVFILLGLVCMLLFLFRGIRAKTLTYIISGIAYMALAILPWQIVASRNSSASQGFDLFKVSFWELSFAAGWTLWNLAFASLLVLIFLIRAVVIVARHDFGPKSGNGATAKQAKKP